ncbi:hypothetical protein ISS37_00900 [candidate division KSB1 bacterium]|nr:hypothetical protein [candidate division KSB1 bacterium]
MKGLMEKIRARQDENGHILVISVFIVLIMTISGLAYLKWAVDERAEFEYLKAAAQAQYLAETGIVERGYMWLEGRGTGNLPGARVPQGGENFHKVGDYKKGRYRDVWVVPTYADTSENDYRNVYNIVAMGEVRYENYKGERVTVRREATLVTMLHGYYTDYLYFTDHEYNLVLGQGYPIRFSSYVNPPDILWWKVWSNEQIHLQGSPQFHSHVYSTAASFGGYGSPLWMGDCQALQDDCFHGNKQPIPFDLTAERLRLNAAVTFDGRGKIHRIRLSGGGYQVWKRDLGTPDWIGLGTFAIPQDRGIFVEGGPLELSGVLNGRLAIGAEGYIRLIDDVVYSGDYNYATHTVAQGSRSSLGIISESYIVIGDTPANGANDSNGRYPTNNDRYANIRITAALIALGDSSSTMFGDPSMENTFFGSFTFENQDNPNCVRDERGRIYLVGAVTQKYRGYVHRGHTSPPSPCGPYGTGYSKNYKYDKRFIYNPPPLMPVIGGEGGRAQFKIVRWESPPLR